MTASKSSVAIPFMAYEAGENPVASSVASLAASLPYGSKVLFHGSQRSSFFKSLQRAVPSVEAVDAQTLQNDNAVFHNGQTDLLIVSLSSIDMSLSAKLAKDDEQIDNVQKVVEQATNGKYVALFAAESVVLPPIETEFQHSKAHVHVTLELQQQEQQETERSVEEIEEAEAAMDDTTDETNPPAWADYFPAWFWEGLVTFLFFTATALVIIYALMYLQTPSVFLSEKKKND